MKKKPKDDELRMPLDEFERKMRSALQTRLDANPPKRKKKRKATKTAKTAAATPTEREPHDMRHPYDFSRRK